MLPIIGLAVAASTLTAGQAALIGGSIGAVVSALGTNTLKQKNKTRDIGKDNDDDLYKEIISEAVKEALRIVIKRHNI